MFLAVDAESNYRETLPSFKPLQPWIPLNMQQHHNVLDPNANLLVLVPTEQESATRIHISLYVEKIVERNVAEAKFKMHKSDQRLAFGSEHPIEVLLQDDYRAWREMEDIVDVK